MRLCPNSFFFNQDIFNSANFGMALVMGFYELWSKHTVSAVCFSECSKTMQWRRFFAQGWRRCAMYTELMQMLRLLSAG